MIKHIRCWRDTVELLKLSVYLQFGKRFWLIAVLALLWLLSHLVIQLLGWHSAGFNESDVQNLLIGFPLYCLSIGMGVRIIAHEIEQRTLEVSYTVSGNARRVWLSKLAASAFLLLLIQVVLSVVTWLVYVEYSMLIFFKVLQGSLFFLVFSMFAGALVRNELAAILVSLVVGYLCLDSTSSKWSAFFNPLVVDSAPPNELVIWIVQNHIGYFLVIFVVVFLSLSRADQRESLLSN